MSCYLEGMKRLTLREQLRHVYWIGGGSAAGKSTIARRIARERGLRVYATDDVMADHARRSTTADCPLLHSFLSMDMDDRWVKRSPTTMLETFHWFQGEGFSLIIEDLLRLPRNAPTIVEGFRPLPKLVKPLLSQPTQAVWLLPTPKFREAVVDRRGGASWGFLAKTSDPERALNNLLERDQMFTDLVRQETLRLQLPTIEVDSSLDEDELTARVTELFDLLRYHQL
ncbi:MAG TPA: hypothetical protein VLB68_14040 [Pyrinomonadaceae bacterium]|nr:hypothetical protein [Pyrinomonadaceae bacterium]